MTQARRSPPRGPAGDSDDPTLQELSTDAIGSVAVKERSATQEDEPPPSFADRFTDWRRHYLPLPDEVVHEYLAEDEYVIHSDHPSFRAFLIQNMLQVGIATALLPVVFAFVRMDLEWWWILLIVLGLDLVLLVLAIKRLGDRYTSYVITNLRLIRVSGIIGRKLASIPWTRMTGLGYRQKPIGRLMGFATIFIESANEESGLREFSDINDPAAFHQLILDMVSSKVGPKPEKPTKGVRRTLWQRRRDAREATERKAAEQAAEAQEAAAASSSSGPVVDTAGPAEASSTDDVVDPPAADPPRPRAPVTPPAGTPIVRTGGRAGPGSKRARPRPQDTSRPRTEAPPAPPTRRRLGDQRPDAGADALASSPPPDGDSEAEPGARPTTGGRPRTTGPAGRRAPGGNRPASDAEAGLEADADPGADAGASSSPPRRARSAGDAEADADARPTARGSRPSGDPEARPSGEAEAGTDARRTTGGRRPGADAGPGRPTARGSRPVGDTEAEAGPRSTARGGRSGDDAEVDSGARPATGGRRPGGRPGFDVEADTGAPGGAPRRRARPQAGGDEGVRPRGAAGGQGRAQSPANRAGSWAWPGGERGPRADRPAPTTPPVQAPPTGESEPLFERLKKDVNRLKGSMQRRPAEPADTPEKVSARDAIAAVRRGPRLGRNIPPLRRPRFPNFGRSKPTLPPSRQLPAGSKPRRPRPPASTDDE